MYKFFIILILLLPVSLLAQITVTGKVLDRADNKPVADASVFLSNTTIGAKSAGDGTFILTNAKPGKYELIITVIGYETYRQKITIDNSNIRLPAITISSKTNALNEVVIKAKPPKKEYFDWFYETFKEQFLGKTELAKDCKILNPEVLIMDYDETTNTITATSKGFLEIENDALGYKIQYLLTDFSYTNIGKYKEEANYEGFALFTELKGTPQQERRWKKMRQEVYNGSAMHFLRSALSDKIDENGFKVMRLAIYHNPERPPDSLINASIKKFKQLKATNEKRYKDSLAYWDKKSGLREKLEKLFDYPINKGDIIGPTDQPGLFTMGCDYDELFVAYNKNHHFQPRYSTENLDGFTNTENSLITFVTPLAFFDRNGVVVNPGSVFYRGVWSRGRMAWLLPADYESSLTTITYADTVLNNISGKIDSYASSQNNEKVYLHLDKPNYGFGDTIWYKAYTVIGQKHQLSALSGVLHVELISPKDSLVMRQSIPLVSGIGWSDIPLSHTLKQGNYRIRAYTRWMENKGPDYFYDQSVRIGGVETVKSTAAAEHPDVQFFPEGGELVTGVRSRVAVKAVGLNGLGQDIKGTIEDNTGTIVADFATQHLGMGAFAFIPEAGKSYKDKINVAGETTYSIDLPKANETGYTLTLNNADKDSIYLKIATNDKTLVQDKDKTFYIIAQSNGKVCFTSEGKLESTTYLCRCEKSRFPEGIAQFTLFDQSGEPMAERIAFIENKSDEIILSLQTDNQNYTTRQKTKLTITAKDSSNKPITGSFSVAVINESKVQPDENNESTILNNLLLTSKLKGHIEQSNYYFTHQNDKTRADLDLLMLTQGYRRYEWKQILSNNAAANNIATLFQPERSLELSGTLKTPSGQPISNGKVTLATTKQNLFRDTTADADGKFTFTNLNLTDTAIVVLKARKANNGSNVKIIAFSPDYPKIYPALNKQSVTASTDTTRQTLAKKQYSNYQAEKKNDSLKNGKTLNTVTITGLKRPKTPDIPNSSNLHSGGNADQVIMYDQMGDGADLASRLTGKVHFVGFNGNGSPVNLRSGLKMAIVVDGVTMTGDHLDDINADDVYSIEVIRTSFAKNIYGSSLPGDGALIITTKRGVDERGTKTTDTTQKFTATQQYTDYEKQQKDEFFKNGKTLKTVTIKGIQKPKQPVLLYSANLNGPGHADQVLMWNQLSDGCVRLSDCLYGRLAGVYISPPGGGVEPKRKAYLQRAAGRLSGYPPMVVIVDGAILDGDHLDDVNVNDIYSIEVLRSGAYLAIYGSNAPGGALVITTKRGGEGTAYFTQAAPNGIMTFPFTGYYKTKSFYTPKYESKAGNVPDNRTTVYWNPNIITDKDGKASIEYFNNNAKGTYRVVIEGIDDEGNIGRQVYRYKVE